MGGALAEVLAGWTGTLSVNGIMTTPRARESVASLIARAIADCYAQTGLSTRWAISSAGVLSVSAASAFDIVVSSNTATRTGLTGAYTGATSYTAAGAYTGAYVPTQGLRVDRAGVEQVRGGMLADGALAFAGDLASGRVAVTLWTSYADAWDAEADVRGVYDVWHDGRVFARVRVDQWRREPLSGLLRSGVMRLVGEGTAVVE